MKFNDLEFGPGSPFTGGIQAKHFFPNGYGASVILSPVSYGSDQGLYELAVLEGNERKWRLCYDTPVTEDVIGNLTETGVENLLATIEALEHKIGV
jgi:hypothetical protein